MSKENDFKGKISMIMGKVEREANGWQFKTIGDAKNIDQTIDTILKNYM